MGTTSIPVPNAEEVAEFKRLYLETRGIELSDDEALDLALRFLQFYYFATNPPTKENGGLGWETKGKQGSTVNYPKTPPSKRRKS